MEFGGAGSPRSPASRVLLAAEHVVPDSEEVAAEDVVPESEDVAVEDVLSDSEDVVPDSDEVTADDVLADSEDISAEEVVPDSVEVVQCPRCDTFHAGGVCGEACCQARRRASRLLTSADLAGCFGGVGTEGWNRDRGSGSDHHETGSNASSSRSGTIVSNLSTAYASNGSRFSTSSMEAAMHFDSLRIHGDSKTWGWEAAEEDTRYFITSLLMEFFGAPSANCSKRGVTSAVERCLNMLGVGWLLLMVHLQNNRRRILEDGASAVEGDRNWISSWSRALDLITHTLCVRSLLFPDPDCGSVADEYHLTLFVQETILKILTFVDVVLAWYPDTMEYSTMNKVMNNKLVNLLLVHDALSEASNKIVALFDSPTYVEVETIDNEMVIVLSAYKSKVSEVIRSTMEKMRVILMEDGDHSPSPLYPQGSSDIHKVTWSVMAYVRFLNKRSRLVNQVMQGHVPCAENIRPVDTMIVEMVSSLQEKLVNISESFSDQGLKLLFLLNNSKEIQLQLQFFDLRGLELLDIDLEYKIEGYKERYLQLSWAPLLSCLFNPTPLCLGKIYSPLSKFEVELMKIYPTQIHLKVQNPAFRTWLRKVITDKIIPGYTEYIEGNKVTNPEISPQELKERLQKLFEG